MKTSLSILKNIFALIIASGFTYGLGTILSTLFVLQTLPVNIPLSEYIATMIFDLKGLTLYFIVILIGFIIAFPIAAMMRKYLNGRLTKLAPYGFPIAGAAAIATALGLMYLHFETIPISGANSGLGYLCQICIGALGGFVFGRLQAALAKQ